MWISREKYDELVGRGEYYSKSCVEKRVHIMRLVDHIRELEDELREVKEKTAACETHEELVRRAFDMRESCFCKSRTCTTCPIPNVVTGAVHCADFIEANPAEAIEIMRKVVE